jgi:hypothetical protein
MKESDFKIIKKTNGVGDTWYHVKWRVTLFGITLFWKYAKGDGIHERHFYSKIYFRNLKQCNYFIKNEIEEHNLYMKRKVVKTETIKQ